MTSNHDPAGRAEASERQTSRLNLIMTSNYDPAGRAEAAETRESGLREELQQQASLVQTLENDLLAAQHSTSGSQDLSQQAASGPSLPDPGVLDTDSGSNLHLDFQL